MTFWGFVFTLYIFANNSNGDAAQVDFPVAAYSDKEAFSQARNRIRHLTASSYFEGVKILGYKLRTPEGRLFPIVFHTHKSQFC